jgi:hypothetical protein
MGTDCSAERVEALTRRSDGPPMAARSYFTPPLLAADELGRLARRETLEFPRGMGKMVNWRIRDRLTNFSEGGWPDTNPTTTASAGSSRGRSRTRSYRESSSTPSGIILPLARITHLSLSVTPSNDSLRIPSQQNDDYPVRGDPATAGLNRGRRPRRADPDLRRHGSEAPPVGIAQIPLPRVQFYFQRMSVRIYPLHIG